MGVTGTLDSLNEEKKFIIKNTYGITLNTIIPSVFGENKR